jgi:hypothetical protein
MPLDNFQNHPDDVSAGLRLLSELESGSLDGMQCPRCQKNAVSVWFTHPLPEEYRTWFICACCGFMLRAQNSRKPRHFADDRIDPSLEKRDWQTLMRMRPSENP